MQWRAAEGFPAARRLIRKGTITIETLKKIGRPLFAVYFAIGAVSIGLLAAMVIFAVIMRYCFALNWKELSEFNTTLFAFSTFWGMGSNIIKDEHVMIDILYDRVKPALKRWLAVANHIIVLIVDVIFTHQGWLYAKQMGKQISMGMEIPMFYMYGIMPLCGVICAVCVIVKIVMLITADVSYFEPKNQVLTAEDPA